MEKKEEKKTTHRRLLVTLVLMMSLAWSMIAMAGKTGWQQEEGLWHFYDKDGVMVCDEFKKSGNSWFYLNEDGVMVTGELIEDGDDLYYASEAPDPDDSNDKRIAGALVSKQWIEIGSGNWYFFGSDMKAVKGLKTINQKLYFFGEDAKAFQGLLQIDSDTYYFGEDYTAWKGWLTIGSDCYYFGEDFRAYKNKNGVTIGGVKYSFDSEGKLMEFATPSVATARQALESLTYNVDQEDANSEDECIDYVLSYAQEYLDQIPGSDSIYIKASPSNCTPAVAGTSSKKTGTDGKFKFKFLITLDTDEGEIEGMTRLLTLTIKATPYHSSSSGGSSSSGNGSSSGSSSSSGSRSVSQAQQYLDAVARHYTVSGTWEEDGGKWRLKKPDGSYLTEAWAYLSGKWYYMGKDTYMITGLTAIGDQVFYLNPITGEMMTGWQQLNGTWYYFCTDKEGNQGAMLKDITTPDGYHVNEDGVWIP